MTGQQRGLVAMMFSKPVAGNALRVSLVVGLCLNLINRGPALWHGASPDWLKLALNHVVPFLVASYSGARMAIAPGG